MLLELLNYVCSFTYFMDIYSNIIYNYQNNAWRALKNCNRDMLFIVLCYLKTRSSLLLKEINRILLKEIVTIEHTDKSGNFPSESLYGISTISFSVQRREESHRILWSVFHGSCGSFRKLELKELLMAKLSSLRTPSKMRPRKKKNGELHEAFQILSNP